MKPLLDENSNDNGNKIGMIFKNIKSDLTKAAYITRARQRTGFS